MEEKKIIRFQDLSISLKIIIAFAAMRIVFWIFAFIFAIILMIFGIE